MGIGNADIGVIGLAVMGENLALNMESRGFHVAVFNRTTSKVDDLVGGRGKGRQFVACHSLPEFVKSLRKPRRVFLMVKAGHPVDATIEELLPLLERGDIVMDGGNSLWTDTVRRARALEAGGLRYLGVGVSGGEEGALHGPSIMPGGTREAYEFVEPILTAIAAKVGPNRDIPCCRYIGPDGAGHFVKMVHNGIEYGDMQLISEAYALLSGVLGMGAEEMAGIFADWDRGTLDSYLVEITADILRIKDPDTGVPMVDVILDKAGQKGTGQWTSEAALGLGVATPTLVEAVLARMLSAAKADRVAASAVLHGPETEAYAGDRRAFVQAVHDALYCAKICSYAQGFQLLAAASKEHGWNLDLGGIALLWRGGCIIRAQFLEDIHEAFARENPPANLLVAPFFAQVLNRSQSNWRLVVAEAARRGVPVPGFSSALSYFDGFRSERLPANLLQAQRDYFGAHTFERVDREGSFHFDWAGVRR